jgi:membrane protein
MQTRSRPNKETASFGSRSKDESSSLQNDGVQVSLSTSAENAHTRLGTYERWLKDFFPNLRDAAIRWSEDDAGSMAASVAYYLALSLFPMLLLLITGLGLFLEFSKLGRDAQSLLLDQISEHGSEVIREQVSQVLQQFKKQSVVSGPIGTLMAVIAAIAVFAQLDRGFDKVWRIPTRKSVSLQRSIFNVLKHRCFAFLMLLSLGGMVALLFVAQLVISQVREVAFSRLDGWFGIGQSRLGSLYEIFRFFFVVGVNGLLFGLVYKWLPKKEVGWNEALRGGLLASIVWELGRIVLGVFLIGMKYTVAYGVIGSFIALLLWCYYGMSIVFFGAEYVQVLQENKKRRVAVAGTGGIQFDADENCRSDEDFDPVDSIAVGAANTFSEGFDSATKADLKQRPRLRKTFE